jgi:peptidoglycan/LPS O-acetylase OafA/YrhL
LVHFFLVPVCLKATHRIGWDIPDRGYAMFCLCTLLSIALAALSWQVFESPINGLKCHFQYPSPADREGGDQAASPRRQAA